MTEIDTLSDELVQQAKAMANENAALRTVLGSIRDMIVNCSDTPTNPDSLPQMIVAEIDRVVTT